jgi:hypothetical protein
MVLAPSTTIIEIERVLNIQAIEERALNLPLWVGTRMDFTNSFTWAWNILMSWWKLNTLAAFVYYEKAQKAFGTPFCDILTSCINPM